MSQSDPGETTKMRTVALDVVASQARLCGVKMDGIETKIVALTEQIADLTANVNALTTQVAVLKVRVGVFAAVATALPIIVVLIRDWIGSL